eukprot:TRINITY_DN14010_c2_g3_i1.p1 TRINITY_DN14010_c2_g3~~TRINITY_DN14010_c2_g3_i1.p1  ORF type:complete len:509 (+),score=77.68 TRINITY_DN14010_c2_g3_i1:69-1529(+)
MLYLPHDESEGEDVQSNGTMQGCKRISTPSVVAGAQSVSCLSLEVKNGYEASMEKALLAAVIELDNKLSILPPHQPLCQPKGMVLAPYRPLGLGMQVMAERSLICEWSLFHSFSLKGVSSLHKPLVKHAPRARTPLNPTVFTTHNKNVLAVTGQKMNTMPHPERHRIEAANGGHYEDDGLPTEETLCECGGEPSPIDLSGLSSYVTRKQYKRLGDQWSKSKRGKIKRKVIDDPETAFKKDVVAEVVKDLWCSAVVPALAALVPPQGVVVVEDAVRSSTANSTETECSTTKASNRERGAKGVRPHTGEPRNTTDIWAPPQEAGAPLQPLPPPSVKGPVEKKKKRKAEKKKGKKHMRLDEYVTEQNRLFAEGLAPYAEGSHDAIKEYKGGDRASSGLALPPLYTCAEAPGTLTDSGGNLSIGMGTAAGGSITPLTSLRDSPSPLDVSLPTILSRKPVISSRYDWPLRAQTAIPSRARALRLQQQFEPS